MFQCSMLPEEFRHRQIQQHSYRYIRHTRTGAPSAHLGCCVHTRAPVHTPPQIVCSTPPQRSRANRGNPPYEHPPDKHAQLRRGQTYNETFCSPYNARCRASHPLSGAMLTHLRHKHLLHQANDDENILHYMSHTNAWLRAGGKTQPGPSNAQTSQRHWRFYFERHKQSFCQVHAANNASGGRILTGEQLLTHCSMLLRQHPIWGQTYIANEI
jgi:hypothetical protein